MTRVTVEDEQQTELNLPPSSVRAEVSAGLAGVGLGRGGLHEGRARAAEVRVLQRRRPGTQFNAL